MPFVLKLASLFLDPFPVLLLCGAVSLANGCVKPMEDTGKTCTFRRKGKATLFFPLFQS